MDASRNPGIHLAEPTVVVDDISVVYRTKQQSGSRTTSRTSMLGALRKGKATSSPVRTTALKNVSFVANQGDSIGVIGRNGSGKSTLMKVLAGLIIPDAGTVYAASNPILLGVNAALISSISGAQNIRLGCLAMGMSHAQIDAKFNDIVEMSGLEDEIYHPMNSYSSGMGARLRFAIAAAVDPEILLVDEALNTGDAQFKERSKARMKQVTSQAGTVFIVSHSIETIVSTCNRAFWIDKGDFIMDGTPKEVAKQYKSFIWRINEGNADYGRKIRAELMASLPAMRTTLLPNGWKRSR
ncbi:sugar ABC transporter ATPase [Arthrobacter sp. ZBG10]|uniref:ABC transporter ATP-binding protein n=1 Tax=Micrococcaceae TaxID=1268 RepID=UPI0006814B4E|nr:MULTISPECIES: ATP-binding cassette domain-containing protein [Micrococcaceae]KNH15849.1 sugar ABC transporter ATPase [Arthrobacter sp. ZBG10]KQR03486.1 polysaccharide/polyol phosphate ABC transporter ATP-binding protein [Arthrobacter sp. Leaf141]